MRNPKKVNMFLKFIHKAEPRPCEYFLPVFANALDPEGDFY